MPLKKPKKIPTNPGIYIFSRGAKPLYVGKALNLKKRVVSYFQKSNGLPPKIHKMLGEATALKFIETDSEIEALIKEAELIKKYRPKYNSLMRDDKNYFFVGITKEKFPRIFITHQPDKIRNSKFEIRNKFKILNSKRVSDFGFRASDFQYIGPFTGGSELYTVLKLLRRIFPYCTCKGVHKRPCLNSQIGKCVGYCCSPESRIKNLELRIKRREYRKNIRNIVEVLSGGRTRLVSALRRRLKETSKEERYEEAARLRDQIWGLESVFRHRSVIRAPESRTAWPQTMTKLQAMLKIETPIRRIEGYDISNIAGEQAAGSMVVFVDGQPAKSEYRKFRIKTVKGVSDVDMIKEVVSRRFKHREWPHPELIVIDGGRGQLNAAIATLRELRIKNRELRTMTVTALAKREEILFTEGGRTIHLKRQDSMLLHLFQHLRDESHRFARLYHHTMRRKSMITTFTA